MPKISVIMPVYNGEQYLETALDSLLSQSFQDWELIVIDDGSTDQTPEILSRYTDVRIRVFQQNNGGEARARNAGLDRVTGEYVAFLDADDAYLPNALEDFTHFLDTHAEFGVIFSDGYFCDSQGNRGIRLTEIRPGIYTGNILEHIILNPAVITVPVCTAFRNEIVKQHDVRFDPEVGYGTDWDFWTRLAVHVQYGYLDTATCLYRVHDTNMTRSATVLKRKSDHIKGRMKVFQAEWFASLPGDARRRFLQGMIVELHSHLPDEQMQLLRSEQVYALPATAQAHLWRLTGSSIIQNHQDLERARACFQQAQQLDPGMKANALILTTHLGKPLARMFFQAWQNLAQFKFRLGTLTGKTQKRIPQQLLPERNEG